jgi:leucine rich repeat (LRR) protein
VAQEDLRKKFNAQEAYRGSQVIYGERHRLEEVLQSLMGVKLPRARKQAESKALARLIRVRTEELNRINPSWDRKFKKARNPKTTSGELLKLASALPSSDYLLARVLSEHPKASSELLEHLASHSYSAVRENVARHPNTPPGVLRKLAQDPKEPLWFLVACNPSTPPNLRESLRARIRQMAAPPV